MEILRFTTAGSVDNGKSTLIGRLLFDSKAIFQDQIDELTRSSKLRGEQNINLAHLTDGLRAEREQGITIDVAYRFFSTPKRKFIIVDTPGHFQFTRNMVTGASTAHLAIVLVDSTQGVTEQTNRHIFIANLLGIQNIVVCVNKMDLVQYSQMIFDEIRISCQSRFNNLTAVNFIYIPISALRGDNIVLKSEYMPWYNGPILMHVLENISITPTQNHSMLRLPIQMVINNPHWGTRYMGRIASGSIEVGQKVLLLPQEIETEVIAIEKGEKQVETAIEKDSISLTLKNSPEANRGSILVNPTHLPSKLKEINATLCWLLEKPHKHGTSYKLMHTTQEAECQITEVNYIYNMHNLEKESYEGTLGLNDICNVRLMLSKELYFDTYNNCKQTGSFILIDQETNDTVAAGMVC